MKLQIEKDWFIDEKGRKTLLRGINLGGSTKVPKTPNGATHIKTDFHSRDVSFVGRPFSINSAREHFQRIKHWGFNAIRFLVTWEAIEHEKPNHYDYEYLDYLEEILKIAETFKFYIIIDPHQDVWSRASGGDGAPIWTFEKVGLDVFKFDQSEAAIVMQNRYDPQDLSAYPPMCWIQNLVRFAPSCMFTLFFGGKDFAPSCQMNGKNVQEFLQQQYFKAMQQVAHRVKDFSYVLGFETLNEPTPGWIGYLLDGSDVVQSKVIGYAFTPFEAMVTASGIPREIPYQAISRFKLREIRRDLLNPEGVSCWQEGVEDFWQREGLWEISQTGDPVIIENEHFMKVKGKSVNFTNDYFAPFVLEYSKAIREVIPEAIIFLVPPYGTFIETKSLPRTLPEQVVFAPHWYDGLTIASKRFFKRINYDVDSDKLVIGAGKIQRMFNRQLAALKTIAKTPEKTIPTVLGEFGLCFDFNQGEGFRKWRKNPEKAWTLHILALSRYYHAVDANLLHSMQWNYTADNDNTWGDQWNKEDFSIFSLDQQTDQTNINSGGRAIKGFCRPHFLHVAGTPLKTVFSLKLREWQFEFDAAPEIDAPTILYVPQIHFPKGYEVDLTEGNLEATDDSQLIAFWTKKPGFHRVIIRPKKS